MPPVTIISPRLADVMSAAAPLVRQGAECRRCIHRNGYWRLSLTHRKPHKAIQEAQA